MKETRTGSPDSALGKRQEATAYLREAIRFNERAIGLLLDAEAQERQHLSNDGLRARAR